MFWEKKRQIESQGSSVTVRWIGPIISVFTKSLEAILNELWVRFDHEVM